MQEGYSDMLGLGWEAETRVGPEMPAGFSRALGTEGAHPPAAPRSRPSLCEEGLTGLSGVNPQDIKGPQREPPSL